MDKSPFIRMADTPQTQRRGSIKKQFFFKIGEETEVQNKDWVPANVLSSQWSFF